jgi:hypothetical protein
MVENQVSANQVREILTQPIPAFTSSLSMPATNKITDLGKYFISKL